MVELSLLSSLNSKSRLRLSAHFRWFFKYILINMQDALFHPLFLLALVAQQRGFLTNISPFWVVVREHMSAPPVSNLCFPFLWPFQLRHLWKSFLAPTSEVFPQPPGSGTSHLIISRRAHQRGVAEGTSIARREAMLRVTSAFPSLQSSSPSGPVLSSPPRIRLPLLPPGG